MLPTAGSTRTEDTGATKDAGCAAADTVPTGTQSAAGTVTAAGTLPTGTLPTTDTVAAAGTLPATDAQSTTDTVAGTAPTSGILPTTGAVATARNRPTVGARSGGCFPGWRHHDRHLNRRCLECRLRAPRVVSRGVRAGCRRPLIRHALPRSPVR